MHSKSLVALDRGPSDIRLLTGVLKMIDAQLFGPIDVVVSIGDVPHLILDTFNDAIQFK
jgi:pyridoxal biosynthesis lyase PdxS